MELKVTSTTEKLNNNDKVRCNARCLIPPFVLCNSINEQPLNLKSKNAPTGSIQEKDVTNRTTPSKLDDPKPTADTKLPLNGGLGDNSDDTNTEVTYFSLLRSNRNFRLFLMSYIVAHLGEWLTYLASMSAIAEIQNEQIGNVEGDSSSRMAISLLIVIRLIPNILLSPIGGALADGRDRRHIMMGLDVCGSLTALLFMFAFHQRSVPLIYLATFLQECVAGLYEPSRSAIIPLMCPGDEEMKKATTMAGVAWSVIAAFGSAAGGFLASLVGIHGCYKMDVVTYLVSAALMFSVGGSWTVEEEREKPSGKAEQNMVIQGISYLRNAFFGGLIFLKASVFIISGANDVLYVSYSERGPPDYQASRLGMLFGSIGVGSFIGPLLIERFNDMDNPRVIQSLCLVGFVVMMVGCLMMGALTSFPLILFSSAFLSMGRSVVWINSSLLLQKFCAPEMLGRVSSIEYSAALLAEGVSAVMAGFLQDRFNVSANNVSLLQGFGCALLLTAWSFYHFSGGGATYDALDKDDSSTVSLTEQEDSSSVSSTDIEADADTSALLLTPHCMEVV
ncbi:hypothetical protein MPSEU_000415000 [Mayamaea pseudoterrestris]|nr:hypothetical protein MPSEU_000415000 [Mayamaea pseudoterrestris]